MIQSIQGPIAFAPDGSSLGCIRREEAWSVVLWDLSQARPAERSVLALPPHLWGDPNNVPLWAWAPDGKALAIVSQQEPGVYWWDVSRPGSKPRPLIVGLDVPGLNTMAYTPDG